MGRRRNTKNKKHLEQESKDRRKQYCTACTKKFIRKAFRDTCLTSDIKYQKIGLDSQ
jgi:hypothetical protein